MMAMTFDNVIQSMDHGKLTSYLGGLISRLEIDSLQDEHTQQLTALMRKIQKELSEDGEASPEISIYKVCFMRGKMEGQAEYFISLSKAKREIRRRLKEMKRQPCIALPCEIIRCGLDEGVSPSSTKSVISNQDLKIKAPGRFKFYEIRTMHNDKIVPIQLVLSQISLQPTTTQKRKGKGNTEVALQFPR